MKDHVVFVNLWQNLCENMSWTARKYFFQKKKHIFLHTLNDQLPKSFSTIGLDFGHRTLFLKIFT